MKHISASTIAVFDCIERHYCLDGQSPSYRVMCAETGLQGKATVGYHLDILEQAGWITREPRLQHAIVPIRQPRVYYVERDRA